MYFAIKMGQNKTRPMELKIVHLSNQKTTYTIPVNESAGEGYFRFAVIFLIVIFIIFHQSDIFSFLQLYTTYICEPMTYGGNFQQPQSLTKFA